ncbi:MAG: hypothetical protein ABR521_09370 [Gaiellaceae bacterium]
MAISGDWDADEDFATASAGTDVRLTWDGDHVYVGAGGIPFGDRLIVAFDLNRGTSDGSNVSYRGVSFAPRGQPDYVFDLNLGWDGGRQFLRRNGNALTNSSHNILFSWSSTGCDSKPFVEVIIERFLFTGGDVSGLAPADDMGVYAWFESQGGSVYASTPASNQTGAPPLAFSSQLWCPTSDAGRSPDTYCGSGPTSATIASFTVRGRTVRWRTVAETGLLGFEVWRDGRRVSPLLPARGGARGAVYRFVDRGVRGRVRHVHRLAIVRADGTRLLVRR